MYREKFKLFHLLFLLFIIIPCYMYLETRWLKITTYQIVNPDIPAAFDEIKIVFIADIHCGPYLSFDRVDRLVKNINRLHPDIIFLGGDYVHRDSKYIIPVFKRLKKLHAPLGIYGVLGNHDHWEGANQTIAQFKASGFFLCDNLSYWIYHKQDSIKIGGVGDFWEDKQFVENTTHDVTDEDFTVLLSHNPDFLEELDHAAIDLTLCGHTHGGQVTLLGAWAPLLPSRYGQKYRYGRKKRDNMDVIITSGVGTITPPVRFFCRPEIVMIRLKRATF
ncbi:metallophosphoesterase [candidate division KSB1 bacterium]|nr:metallophosphoesterase [candidate division KSB1 bacterium]